jgi:putative sterol carrier protein
MSLQTLTEDLRGRVKSAPPLGHKVRFDLGGDGTILWDGTGQANQVGNEDGEAETTISISAEDFAKLMGGELDPTMAYMTGKLKIEGDMGVAMKLSGALGG